MHIKLNTGVGLHFDIPACTHLNFAVRGRRVGLLLIYDNNRLFSSSDLLIGHQDQRNINNIQTNMRLLVLASFLAAAHACSSPQDWAHKSLRELLSEARVVLIGEFLDIEKVPVDGSSLVEFQILTQVKCVLKNILPEVNLRVPSNVVISDVQQEGATGQCINNLHNVTPGGESLIFIKINEEGKYVFDNINVQLASYEFSDALTEVGKFIRSKCGDLTPYVGRKQGGGLGKNGGQSVTVATALLAQALVAASIIFKLY